MAHMKEKKLRCLSGHLSLDKNKEKQQIHNSEAGTKRV